MTQEEKQLLLKDLCARLPYDVLVSNNGQQEFLISIEYGESFVTKDVVTKTPQFTTEAFGGQRHLLDVEEIKPYLRPMSNITVEEKKELENFVAAGIFASQNKDPLFQLTREALLAEFFNKHHLDYRGLIHMGLALEAKEGMYEKESV